jgi:hypothetical protein
MVISSRKTLLPSKPKKVVSTWWCLAGCIVLWLAALLFKVSLTVLSWFSLVIFLTVLASLVEKQRLRKVAQNRQADSICSFARSFDCRQIDTRIIRAVYEELQQHGLDGITSFPIRATDRLEMDLGIDPEDIDNMAYEIAARTQHSMNDCEENPLYGKVKTVTDLILFFTHQPAL